MLGLGTGFGTDACLILDIALPPKIFSNTPETVPGGRIGSKRINVRPDGAGTSYILVEVEIAAQRTFWGRGA